ncbi:MAG: sigma 54-interacting transcriptional regulator [Bacteroidota bacterium]
MDHTTQDWIKESCFQVAEQLGAVAFVVDKSRKIDANTANILAILNTNEEKQASNFINELLLVIPKSDWDHFWRSRKSCYQLDEILVNEQLVNLILVSLEDGTAIGFLLLDDLQTSRLEKEYLYLLEESNLTHNFKEIISQSESYLDILKQVEQVADADTTVLIKGETGSGKELLARAIHNFSNRRKHPLFKINCAATTVSALESSLFGHEKGAFVGAFEQKIGYFELANGATLLLDEVGELPLEFQGRLLRVLQEGSFERIGGSEPIKSDLRIIATTNKDLEQMMRAGKFRQDLYYRLNVFPIHSIPLRERRDDIPLLVKYFKKKYAKKMGKQNPKVSSTDIRHLMRYDFPGNVRELENIIERAVILTKGEQLNLKAVIPDYKLRVDENGHSQVFLSFEEMQRRYIIKALEKAQWRVSGKYSAAELLDLNPKTLTSKMRKLNINRKELIKD